MYKYARQGRKIFKANKKYNVFVIIATVYLTKLKNFCIFVN